MMLTKINILVRNQMGELEGEQKERRERGGEERRRVGRGGDVRLSSLFDQRLHY